jgi:hypothetical protein
MTPLAWAGGVIFFDGDEGRRQQMRIMLSAFAALSLLAGIAALQPAEARCFPDGGGVTCVRPAVPMFGYGYRHYFYRDFDRPIYRDWY